MSEATQYFPGIQDQEVHMPDANQTRIKRVQAYVTELTLKRLTAIAQDRSLTEGGHISVSELASTIIDEWLAANPEAVKQADRRLHSLSKRP